MTHVVVVVINTFVLNVVVVAFVTVPDVFAIVVFVFAITDAFAPVVVDVLIFAVDIFV